MISFFLKGIFVVLAFWYFITDDKTGAIFFLVLVSLLPDINITRKPKFKALDDNMWRALLEINKH